MQAAGAEEQETIRDRYHGKVSFRQDMRFTERVSDHLSPSLLTAVASCEELQPFRLTGQCVFPGEMDAITADKIGIPFTGVENRAFQGIIDEAGTQVLASLVFSGEFEARAVIRASLSCTAAARAKAGEFFRFLQTP